MDKMRITILPGGLVKVETDRISTPSHLSADRLLRGLEEHLGGETQIERKSKGVLADEHKRREHDLS
jgi:hypothetical protein